MEVSEENLEVESLTKVPPKESQERTPRPKMQTKTDAGTAVKLVTGSKTTPRRRKTRREMLRTPSQASVKSLKISMGQELQICSMELQRYMWKVMKKARPRARRRPREVPRSS